MFELGKKDFWDYANASHRDPNRTNQIAMLLVKDPNTRKQMALLKRDFFLLDAQMPKIELNREFSYEIAKTCNEWLKLNRRKGLPVTSLLFSREALFIALFLVFALFGIAMFLKV